MSSGPHSRLPVQFGRYLLTKRLGAGGMAEAFLAQVDGPSGFKKQCVVKVMLPHLAGEERFVAMFQKEARLAALLTHGNVVQIYELGDVDGTHFIAMEHVDGLSLSALARRAWGSGRSVPTEVTCCAVADAALGLAAAHALRDADGLLLGVVHRDISPDNLMMNKDGVTKVLDFGVAKLTGSDGEPSTATGELKGKIPFLAPEYILGKGMDGRSDLYSLGVTFYWFVTGKRPFTASGDLPLMEAIVKEAPRPPSELNPQVPPQIEEMILRLLEKDPARRPQTGFEVYDKLLPVLASRREVVVPFLEAMLLLSPAGGADASAGASGPIAAAPRTPGFVPSTPHTEGLKSEWRRRLAASVAPTEQGAQDSAALTASRGSLDAPAAEPAAGDAEDVLFTSTGTTSPSTRSAVRAANPPRTKLFVAAGGLAAAVAAAIVAAVVVSRDEVPANVSATIHAGGEVKPIDEPIDQPIDDVVAMPVVEKPVAGKPHGVGTAELAVRARAPAGVQWLTERGKVLGTGNVVVKVPAATKVLIAVDKKRGGRMTVPVDNGVANFGALPHGKLQPRARPFAEIFLGSELLGTTPFPAIDVVAGTYEVRFVHAGREERRKVTVAGGETARPNVDFKK